MKRLMSLLLCFALLLSLCACGFEVQEVEPDDQEDEKSETRVSEEKKPNTAEEYVNGVIETAREYAAKSEYKTACTVLEQAMKKYKDDKNLLSVYEEIVTAYHRSVKETALTEAENSVKAGDYKSALTKLEQAQLIIGDDEVIRAQKEVYTSSYVALMLERADDLFEKYNAEAIFSAEAVLEEALELLPENEILTMKLAEYKEYEPIRVVDYGFDGRNSSMTASSSTMSIQVLGSSVDNMGEAHTDTFYISTAGYYRSGSLKIETDFQFSKLTGVFFQNEKYKNADAKTKLEIWASSAQSSKDLWVETMSGSVAPSYFDLDISGQKEVNIKFYMDENCYIGSEPYEYAYVAELYLWK